MTDHKYEWEIDNLVDNIKHTNWDNTGGKELAETYIREAKAAIVTKLQTVELEARIDTIAEIEKIVLKTNCEYGTAINRFMANHNISEARLTQKGDSDV